MTDSPQITISAEIADELRENPVATQLMSEHRWYARKLIVVTADALTQQIDANAGFGAVEVLPEGITHFGFHYLEPSSELQEGQDRYESDPVEVFAVVGKPVEITTWSRAEA